MKCEATVCHHVFRHSRHASAFGKFPRWPEWCPTSRSFTLYLLVKAAEKNSLKQLATEWQLPNAEYID
jgi:hypothetical protein